MSLFKVQYLREDDSCDTVVLTGPEDKGVDAARKILELCKKTYNVKHICSIEPMEKRLSHGFLHPIYVKMMHRGEMRDVLIQNWYF